MNQLQAASAPINILSFDIEEWFMLEDTRVFSINDWDSFTPRVEYNTMRILDLLDKKSTPGVFFILGWVAGQYPSLVRQISLAGHEIGYHSFYHHNNDMMSPESFEADLQQGLALIENISGKRPYLYRSPNFSMHAGNLWTIPILMQNGIKVSSSICRRKQPNGTSFPGKPFRWQAGRNEMWEFPLASARVGGISLHYAGSGHFRLLPDFMIQYFTRKADYNMYYFHPRDFDDNPQRSPRLSPLRNFKNAFRTKSALRRLEKLIEKNDFISLSEALNRLKDYEKITLPGNIPAP